MDAAIQSFASGFPVLALHLSVTAAMLVAGAVVYVLLTPHRELELIRANNAAAALSLGAVLVGLSIPLAMALASAVSVWDIVVWGLATLVLQLFLFRITDLILRELPRRIIDGEMAAAVTLAAVKIAGALLLAAALSP